MGSNVNSLTPEAALVATTPFTVYMERVVDKVKCEQEPLGI